MTSPVVDERARSGGETEKHVDVLIVGAGFGGLYALHHLRKLGLTCRVFDTAEGVGGTWYWNRYPGARVDIESVEYSYGFDAGLQQEWEWTERYAAQPELLAYLNHVVDRFDLRPDIQLSTRVETQTYDEATDTWLSTLSTGEVYRSRYVVMATGFLAAPNQPQFEGLEDFRGPVYHSGFWPHDPVDFTGKRVAVIGTGSSGVQMIPEIAKQAAKTLVFQRTAPYIVPLRNHPMDPEFLSRVRDNYADWRENQYRAPGGFIAVNGEMCHQPQALASEVTPEERLADYEARWRNGGLAFMHTFRDVYADETINETLAEFIREKSTERIGDPKLAEKLIPRDFPVLTKRLVCDNDYYEAYDKYDMELVDVKSTPIDRMTAKGVLVGDTEYEVDIIVLATGFDAFTGATSKIDIRGRNGKSLNDHWKNGPRTHTGIMASGFPNLFIIDGPGSPCAVFVPVLLIEYQVQWVGKAIEYLRDHGCAAIDADPAAEDEWVKHVSDVASATLFSKTKSWYMGANIPGKPVVSLVYLGGFQEYSRRLDEAASHDYAGFSTSAAVAAALPDPV